jgi:hypothetical protein
MYFRLSSKSGHDGNGAHHNASTALAGSVVYVLLDETD